MVASNDQPSGSIGNGGHKAAPVPSEPDIKVAQVSNAASSVQAPKVEQSRTERLARMDEKLLSDDLMRDIAAKADRERKGR
jgi:hypothetical protein